MNRSFFPLGRMGRLLFVSLLMLCLTATAFAQSQTGNIFGTVVDKDGGALPGVTVTLSGVGAPQVTVTDENGRFRFPSLSPGSYDVRAELAGFGVVSSTGVAVNIGRNSEVALTLAPAVEQTITVTAETPLLDPRRTGTGATVTRVELEEVPTGRDPWVVLQQVPGVLMDRINIGGSESGQQSTFVSKGSGGDQATFNVDGVNITDMAATGSSPAYYDFDAFEEMQVTTGGTDPRVMTPGAQLNMVTKRGTNEFRGSARYLLTDGEWQSDPEIPAEATGYLQRANEINEVTDMGLEIGGPIIRDRLWAWGAYSDQQIDLFVAQPAGQTQRYFDNTTLETMNLKLNAQLTANNSATGIWTNSEKIKFGRNASPANPPETTFNQGGYGPEGIWKIEDTHIFSPRFFVTGLYSVVNGGFQLIPNSGANCTSLDCVFETNPAPATLSLAEGAWANTFYYYQTERPQDQYRLDASTFFDTGAMNHELRFGFGYRDTPVESFFGWPGDQYTVMYDGLFGPGTENLGGVYLTRSGLQAYDMEYTDIYVGDTMMLGNLTLQAGLRFDNQSSSMSPVDLPAHPLAPEGIFSAQTFTPQGEMEWDSISPRLGVTYTLGSTRRTLLRGAYNRYVDQLGAGTATAPQIYYQYLYYYFEDANGNNRAEREEIFYDYLLGGWNVNLNDPGQLTQFTRFGDDINPPTTDEFLLGFEHELLPNFTVGVNYTHREMDDFIWSRAEKGQGSGDFYTSADYELAGTLTGTTLGGEAYAVPYYRLRAGIDPATFSVIQNRPDYSQTYDGFELNLTKRLSNRWMLRANASYNDWTQDVGPNGFVDPTNMRGGTGCSSQDCDVVQGSGTGSGPKGGVYINSKWQYNITGLYEIPFIDVNFGFAVTGREGYPIPQIQRSPFIANEGTFKNVLVHENVTDERHDDLFNLDLRLAKEFRFADRVGLSVGVDAFNITNEQTVLQRRTRVATSLASGAARPDPTAGRISEFQSPRIFRVGARITF